MHVALYLRHLLAPTGSQCRSHIHVTAIAQNYDTLLAWYKDQLVEPYKEEGPNLNNGQNVVYTKYFHKGSILEWYGLPDSLQFNDEHSNTGIYEIESYEEIVTSINAELQDQIRILQLAAQERLDHYRTAIEPKMISYDPSNAKPTLQ